VEEETNEKDLSRKRAAGSEEGCTWFGILINIHRFALSIVLSIALSIVLSLGCKVIHSVSAFFRL
jgi:hypothetical protein